jgi:curved DNA-binding protein CbpA
MLDVPHPLDIEDGCSRTVFTAANHGQAAGWAQTVLYSIFIRAGDARPQAGSARFIKHRRYILMAVYFAYFAFTIYEADFDLQRSSSAYHELGVPIDVDEAGINSRFRKLTIRFHPDKAGAGADRELANQYFVHLKALRDVVLDPAKRFAYDRFGPAMVGQCQNCVTVKDYVDSALLGTATTYGALLVVLVGANALGYLTDGGYWRYLGILAVAAFDIRTATRPDHPWFLTHYLNPLVSNAHLRPAYLPFQLTAIVKKTAISAAQFLALLMPLYRDDPQALTKPTDDTDDTRHKQLDRLGAFVAESNKDAGRLLELESIPYRENEKAKSELREALKKYMVQNVVQNEREVRNAMGESMARRRTGVPHGAMGTK